MTNPRMGHFSLAALLGMALGALGLPESLRHAEQMAKGEQIRRGRYRARLGKGDKRYRVRNAKGKLVAIEAGMPRPACRWLPSSPVVNGVRMRYEADPSGPRGSWRLVPRVNIL